MRFSIVVSILAAIAPAVAIVPAAASARDISAAPAAAPAAAAPPSLTREDFVNVASKHFDIASAAGCNWISCISALASALAAMGAVEDAICVAAIAQGGADFINDALCLGVVAAYPAACNPCAKSILGGIFG